VLVFAALVVVHGMLVAALSGRYSRTLPPLSSQRRAQVAYLPLLLLIPVVSLTLVIAVGGLVAAGLSLIRPLVHALRSPTATLAGRIALTVVVLIALPGFLSAVADILAEA